MLFLVSFRPIIGFLLQGAKERDSFFLQIRHSQDIKMRYTVQENPPFLRKERPYEQAFSDPADPDPRGSAPDE